MSYKIKNKRLKEEPYDLPYELREAKDRKKQFFVYGNGEYEKSFDSNEKALEYAEKKRRKFPKYNFEVKAI